MKLAGWSTEGGEDGTDIAQLTFETRGVQVPRVALAKHKYNTHKHQL